MRNNWYLLLAAACVFSASTSLQAQQTINIDFDQNAANDFNFVGLAAAPDPAGATAIWTQTFGGSPTVTDAVDSTGVATPAILTIESRGSFQQDINADNEQQSGHAELMRDYLSSRADSNQEDLRTGSWSGLVPGNAYDLYFYGQGDNFDGSGFNSGQNVGVRIGTDVRHTSHDGVGRQLDDAGEIIPGGSGDGSLVEDIEYVVFRGIVADAAGAITFEHFNPGQGLHATDMSFFDTDTGLADADNDPSRFHALNGVQIVGDFSGGAFDVGDVNCDGQINFLDISPFIAVIASGGFEDKADINRDGVVNFLDIQGFIALL